MSENKLLTTSEVAKKLGVTPDCIRKWDESGVLKADYTTEGGHRKYKESTVNEYLEKDTLNDFNKIMANVREEWAKKMYQELSEKIEERTNSYLTDEEKKTCVPVVKIGDYDTISLKKDGFNVSTFFYLSGHPFLSDGNYCTNMKTRYEYMSTLTGKTNPTLEEWMKDDINNVWAYINWEYYYLKDFYFESLKPDEFIKIMLDENFSGIVYCHKYSLKISEGSWRIYNTYITSFAEQVMNYYLINNGKLGHYNEDFRSCFKKGDYSRLCVIFKDGIYTFHFDNDSNNSITIHVFDECKFKRIMNTYKRNLVKCEPVDRLVIYVDDIIDEVFDDVEEEVVKDPNDGIIVDASFNATMRGFIKTVDVSEDDLLKLDDEMKKGEVEFFDEVGKYGITCVKVTSVPVAIGRANKKTDITISGVGKFKTRIKLKNSKEYNDENIKKLFLLKALKEKLNECKYLVLKEEDEVEFTDVATDLNSREKVWKEDELLFFDFPIIGDTEHNRAVSRKPLCPYCKNGNLESKTPTMYNPFSIESQAVCECTYCGETVKTEHAYPRVVFKDENGDDMKVWL